MEYEKRIDELRRMGEANASYDSEVYEEEYWNGFRGTWNEGKKLGLEEGRNKALVDLNIFITPERTGKINK